MPLHAATRSLNQLRRRLCSQRQQLLRARTAAHHLQGVWRQQHLRALASAVCEPGRQRSVCKECGAPHSLQVLHRRLPCTGYIAARARKHRCCSRRTPCTGCAAARARSRSIPCTPGENKENRRKTKTKKGIISNQKTLTREGRGEKERSQ